MKKLLLLVIIPAISFRIGFSQVCFPQGVIFSTQDQIDNFRTNNPGCNSISGPITISGNNISNLNGLNTLTSVGGSLSIGNNDNGNPSLVNLSGLEQLTSIGGYLIIRNNTNLVNVAGLVNLASIGLGIDIENNASVTSLSGLNKLQAISGDIYIDNNDALTNLAGFENLTSIGGSLWVRYNDGLTSLSGLESLHSLGGDLWLLLNNNLLSLSGLDHLASVGGNVWIDNNYSLYYLTGLQELSSIHNALVIIHNTVLNSISVLNHLVSLEGSLFINNNDSLSSLSGLDNLNAGSVTDLHIFSNNSLSTCEIQSVCSYLSIPGSVVEIYDNAVGCNSPQEVRDACLTNSVPEGIPVIQSSVFPNPVEYQTSLGFMINESSVVKLELINEMGIVLSVLQNQLLPAGKNVLIVNAEDLPAGVYCYRIKAARAQGFGKIIVLK